MIFTSLVFLIFFIIVFLTYYLVPKRYRWIILLVGSAVFYFWAGWQYFLFLVATIVFSYCIALSLDYLGDKSSNKIASFRKAVFIFGVVIEAGSLFVLKYLNFFISTFYSIAGNIDSFKPIDLLVPLGVSFYIFSGIGYLVDVYRRNQKAEKNIFKYALFVSFFPTVLQGPICSYSELSESLVEGHDLCTDNVANGLGRIVLGFFKKIVIADLVGVMVSTLFTNSNNYHGFILFIAIVLYVIQLYSDFSGFIDISIGAAEMLGIKLPENFDAPLLSPSLQLFWRRWHISLGRWFKKYIYIPLGGNRVPKWRWIINIMIVWLLTGLWHGASWNYVLWGVYNGVLLVLGGLMAKPIASLKNKKPEFFNSRFYGIFQIVKTFYLVCVGFLFFTTSSPKQALDVFVESLKFWDLEQLFSSSFISLGIDWWMYFVIIGAIAICYFANSLFRKDGSVSPIKYNLDQRLPKWVQYIVFVAICWSIVAVFIYSKSLGNYSSSFIYFEF